MIESKRQSLKIVQDRVNSCTNCELYKTKTNYVFARGNPKALIMLVGEGPGQEEDKSGLPFVGLSGQLLDKILVELDVNLDEDIYVCNIIKCRPPGNRKPSDEEVNQCIDYLEDQLKIINPKVIVALGNTAISNLVNATFGISKIRGKFIKRRNILVMPTYHPSYVIRNGSGGHSYNELKQDLQTALLKSKE